MMLKKRSLIDQRTNRFTGSRQVRSLHAVDFVGDREVKGGWLNVVDRATLDIASRQHLFDQLIGEGALTRFHMRETLACANRLGKIHVWVTCDLTALAISFQ